MTNFTSDLKFTDSLERDLIDHELSALGGNQFSAPDGSALDWFIAVTFALGAVLTATLFH